MYETLLRYPGGKSRAVKILRRYPMSETVISPFLGGGSFEIDLLNTGRKIIANDVYRSLSVFWNVLNSDPKTLAGEIQGYLVEGISKEQYLTLQKKLKQFEAGEIVDLNPVSVASLFYVVNRCSFSGSTLSGGYSKSAAVGRFTESGVNKIKNWVPTDTFIIENMDYTEFLKKNLVSENDWFLDPPYMLPENERNKLYGVNGNYHYNFNHQQLFDLVERFHNIGGKFLLTYNDSAEIRELYKDYNIVGAEWSYGMNKTKKSSEIIIHNKD